MTTTRPVQHARHGPQSRLRALDLGDLGWQRQLASQQRYALLLIGLDDLRALADARGAVVRTTFAQHLQRRLARLLPIGSLLAAIEDDVILVVQPGLGAEPAARLAERIRKTLRQPVRVGHVFLHTSVSVGLCSYPDDADRFETVARRAQIALQRARRTGGNRIEHFDRDTAQRLERHLKMGAGLWSAFEEDRFEIAFQPIVAAQSGRICGVESLMRWTDPRLGIVRPAEFVPELEGSGLIVPVGEWMLRQACKRIRQLHREGHPTLTLNVNVSPRQFEENSFVDRVRAALEESQFPPEQLILEITENLLLVDPESTARRMQKLKNLGVSLVVDDFGTGHAAIGYLQHLPVSGLKIDRSFIAPLPGDRKVLRLTRALVSLGHALQLRMTAEGVETAEQARMLTGLGVQLLQGYHFGRPASAESLAERLGPRA